MVDCIEELSAEPACCYEEIQPKRKKTISVNMYAGPGAGKSSLAASVFSELKWAGVNCELVTEYAKDVVWERNLSKLSNQIYIFGKQYHRMSRLSDQVDVIVTDSPLLLGLVYGEDEPGCFSDLVLRKYEKFSNINLFLSRVKPYRGVGRTQTEDEAIALDEKISEMLRLYFIPYTVVLGEKDSVPDIVDLVLLRMKDMGL